MTFWHDRHAVAVAFGWEWTNRCRTAHHGGVIALEFAPRATRQPNGAPELKRLVLALAAFASLAACRDATFGVGADFGHSGVGITTGASGTSGNVTVGASL